MCKVLSIYDTYRSISKHIHHGVFYHEICTKQYKVKWKCYSFQQSLRLLYVVFDVCINFNLFTFCR